MRRIKSRRTFMVSQASGGDAVMFGQWLPPGSVVHGVTGTCGVEATTVSIAQNVHMGAVEGWVFNVDDLDNLGTMDTEFDIHVPKDSAGLALDLDAGTADTTPFNEPGEMAWEFIFPVGRQPHRVFAKSWMSFMGHNVVMTNQDPETPFAVQFIAGLSFGLTSRTIRVDDPSLIVFAISSPDTLKTSTTKAIEAISEVEWSQLRYIDHVLERAMMSLIGLTETGAETPWDEATLLLESTLEPPMYETAGGMLVPITWKIYGQSIIDMSVSGTMPKTALDTRR